MCLLQYRGRCGGFLIRHGRFDPAQAQRVAEDEYARQCHRSGGQSRRQKPAGQRIERTRGDRDQQQAAERFTGELEATGLEVLVDDRNERPGVKFKDAELIGIPVRITLGRGLATGVVELTDRRTGQTVETSVDEITAAVRAILARAGGT